MIKVVIKKDLIKINGHARFNDYGKDVVCASVSSIVYTTVNGIFNIDSKAIMFKDDKNMEIKIKKPQKVITILIENMISLLEDLANQYPQNIKIEKGE